jgi:hypothetical protein
MSLPWAVGGSKLPGEAPRLKIAGNTCERDMIEYDLRNCRESSPK